MNRAQRRRFDQENRRRFRQMLKEKGPDVVFIVADAQADGPPTFRDDQDGVCSACGCSIYGALGSRRASTRSACAAPGPRRIRLPCCVTTPCVSARLE